LSLYFNCSPHHEDVWGSGGIVPRIVNLGSRWRWVVSFTPRPLYPRGRSFWYQFDRRLGGPHRRSGRGGEEKQSLHCPCRQSNPFRPAHNLITILTELPLDELNMKGLEGTICNLSLRFLCKCFGHTRVYPKVSGLSHTEINNNNNKQSLRSNKKGYGCKTI